VLINEFLVLAAVLFCIGVYGVLARRNGVLVLMSIELILNSVNINLLAFAAMQGAKGNTNAATIGAVFALFIITVAAAEVGVGLALILMLFRNFRSIDIDSVDSMKG
jgi:NADH:ubiquinone oxidoreductase subunit K